MTITSTRPDDTVNLGMRIGRQLAAGDLIALLGPLGAGKTILVKGLARGAGIDDPRSVNSPTFVIVNEYHARCHIHHVDAYRLAGSQDLWALGFEEMCEVGVVVVEWADKVLDLFPPDHLRIEIAPAGDTSRHLALRCSGPRSRRLLTAARS